MRAVDGGGDGRAADGGGAARQAAPYSRYLVLRRGEFVQVVAMQRGVDVQLDLYEPGGREVLAVDSPNSETGPERLFFVAAAGGRYRLTARRLSAAAGGRFSVAIGEPHPPAPVERIRARACQAESDADRERAAGPPAGTRLGIGGYQLAMRLWRSLGDTAAEASAETKLGRAWFQRGDFRAAVTCWQQALDLLAARGLAETVPTLRNRLGLGYERLAEPALANASYEAALASARRLGDRQEEIEALTNLGQLQFSSGASWDALVRLDEALAAARAAGETRGEAAALAVQARVYEVLGKLDEAREAAVRAAAIDEATHHLDGAATAAMELGWVQQLAGDAAAARRDLDHALDLKRASGDRRGEAVVLDRLGTLERETGRPAAAVVYHRRALAIFEAEGDLESEARTQSNLGLAEALSGDPLAGLRTEDQSIPRLAGMGEQSAEGYARCRRALAERALGKREAARQDLEAGLALLDRVREGARSEELRMTYVDSVHDQYEQLVDLLMAMHDHDPRGGFDRAALAAAERARSRGLLDLIAAARLRGAAGGSGSVALHRLREIDERIRDAQTATDAGPAAAPALRPLLAERQRALVALAGDGGRGMPLPPSMAVEQIQGQVLDAGTVLLVYALGERRSYLWALTRTQLVSAALPPRAELEEEALRLHELLVGSRMHGDLMQAVLVARDLSWKLLGPAAALLAGRRIAVVPDGALAYLPFAYLPEPGGEGVPLLAAHEVVELPSASVMAAIRRRTASRPAARRRLAVLADPLLGRPDAGGRAPLPGNAGAALVRQVPQASDAVVSRSLQDLGLRQLAPLPYARQEAASILQWVPRTERLDAVGAAASCDLVRQGSLAPYAILHFAAHALVHPSVPELSGLVLAARDRQDQPRPGFLQSYEIADLRLPADLVVLSACSTGLGRELRGEGLVGLTQSFFQAGAARVLVSLWDVDDHATARLMERFYRELLADGRPPAAALRAAQLALQRDARWAAPYYWAGFELQGDWRPLR